MDMVLNSLAIEFLTQLSDDEFKTMYFDNYGRLKKRLHELEKRKLKLGSRVNRSG